MCDGGITATLIMTAASTAMSMAAQAAQQRQQQAAMNAQAKAQAQALENEKALKQQMAQDELAKGAAEISRQQRDATRKQGEMGAAMGAAGFTLDSGTNLSLLGESAEEAQYDSNIIAENANRAAWQHQVGITGLDNQMSMLSAQRANASTGTDWLGMGGTLLGGIAKGMGQWGDYSATQAGASGGSTFLQNSVNLGYSALGRVK